MKNVHVNASGSYDITIGSGLLPQLGALLKPVKSDCRVAVITDDTVNGFYGDAVTASLEREGYRPAVYVFPNGEHAKNLGTYTDILEFLAAEHFTRGDMILALGGGVPGDIGGFAAATYLRGVPVIQAPTTFLAAVDSSVGGKTGVNLSAGKNLAGAFWQPSAVFCDCDTFKTLPAETLADGISESIKYGCILDRGLFEKFEAGVTAADYEEVVERCVSIKRDVVEKDERDTGLRQLLNFGHTVGHGIEKNAEYEISHGHAVAVGMVIAAGIAEKLGFAQESCRERIVRTLQKYGLPTKTVYSAEALAKAALSDKKRNGSALTLILPRRIGECALYKTKADDVEKLIALGLEETV